MAAKKPNILYIMADQMAAPLISLYNSSSAIKTPNIDKLAEAGVVFESAYCNSPLCAPSRFTMVSGQLPSRIGGYDNASDLPADTPTYSHYLRAQGYHTALSGKMHFAGPDQLHGYEERLTTDIYPGDYGWTVDWDRPDLRKDWYHDMSSVLEAGPCVRSNQLDFDDEVVHRASQYLYDHVRYRNGQPFCLTVSMTHPHDPYTMTRDYWDMYEDVEIPLPKTTVPQNKLDPHSQRILEIIDLWGKEIPEERIKAARRAYFAACTYVDTQIGKLMNVLKNCGLADDTIVVFTGDHGDMLGEKGLWYKMVWYEMSARVPMLVFAPGRYHPKRVKENVSTMDLLPTFVAMSGGSVDPALPLDGVSLMPYLDENCEGEKTDTVLGEYMAEGTLAPVVMIRRGPWKFIYSPIDPPMLFNVEADPTESTNLAEGIRLPSHKEVAKHIPQAAAGPKTTAPAPLPTPTASPLPQAVPTPFFDNSPRLFTPPRSPSPTKGSTVSSGTTSPSQLTSLLASFYEEAHARWDFKRLQEDVLNSQRRRRLVYSALIKGKITTWDYTPQADGGEMYIRNVGQSALGNVEFLNRWPRVGREVQYRP